MNNFDFMRSPSPNTVIEYPLIHESPDRVQIIFKEDLYGMLILNQSTGKWCGYTLLSQHETEWYRDSWRVLLGVSYLAPANDPITWMHPDRWGRLTVPATLLDDGDYWLGFHSDETGNPIRAIAELSRFAYRVSGAMRIYANPTV